jgi:hypothetical protein
VRRAERRGRQHHVAGDKVFVDYSGKKVGIADPATGEVRDAEIFVAVLGASNYTYAEAAWTQALPDWIGAHVRLARVGVDYHVEAEEGLASSFSSRPLRATKGFARWSTPSSSGKPGRTRPMAKNNLRVLLEVPTEGWSGWSRM